MEGKRCKQIPISLVELILEFNPMQSQSVQEALHAIHHQKDTNRYQRKQWVRYDNLAIHNYKEITSNPFPE